MQTLCANFVAIKLGTAKFFLLPSSNHTVCRAQFFKLITDLNKFPKYNYHTLI